MNKGFAMELEVPAYLQVVCVVIPRFDVPVHDSDCWILSMFYSCWPVAIYDQVIDDYCWFRNHVYWLLDRWLMIIDDYWWLLMLIDDYWWLWWLLVIFDDYWWLLMIIDWKPRYWWWLTNLQKYIVTSWLLTIHGYWRLLMIDNSPLLIVVSWPGMTMSPWWFSFFFTCDEPGWMASFP